MALEVNKHVERLSGYLPFDADTSQLFQEFVEPSSDVLATGAFDYVLGLLGRPGCQLVVLTGDAGHGKTHLCFRLLVAHGASAETAQHIIRTQGDGSSDLATTAAGRALRIVKDLSDFTTDAAVLLEDALQAPNRVTVICANEGRLRKAIQDGSDDLDIVRRTLEEGARGGQTSLDDATFVVNLNFQSVAASGGASLTAQLLQIWAKDQRKWRTCHACDARPACPIFENHRLLGAAPEASFRRERFDALLRLVERTGTVATIRELLIVTSLAITGGLRCHDVHRRHERNLANWQHAHLFHQAVFGSSLAPRDRDRVRLLRGLAQVDPAAVASRGVDDQLSPSEGDSEGWFLPAVPSMEEPSARTRMQFRRDATRQHHLIGFLRRRSFFNDMTGVPLGERAGLRHASAFDSVVDGALDEQARVHLRDKLISGLEAIQGVRRPPQANFFVVDPAFTSHRSSASVVARQLAGSRIDFMSQQEWWRHEGGERSELASALDWSDRSVFVRFHEDGEAAPVHIELDLLRFELVLRYAEGLSAREHFHADLRRITSSLASLATASDSAEITVLVQGERRKLSIDVGNRIRALDG